MPASSTAAVSIVVVNHNYASFLAEAIESALCQTHAAVEVIVVDDGSTDDSRAVIRRYDDRVRAVYKENGGQASAFNAGFRHATGEAVIFLDADDMLEPGTAARAAAALAERPELAKVHYRLEVMDVSGRRRGTLVPPAGLPLPSGDLRSLLREHPDDIPYPPASGNAFAAWALARVLPMPEEDYRILADVYLLNLVPLLGPVRALDGTGGRYRVHAGNSHYAAALRLDRVRATVRVTHTTHGHMRTLARRHNLGDLPAPEHDDRSLVFLTHRMVSLKLEPELHPFPHDSLKRLVSRGIAAALGRPGLSLGLKVLYPAWLLAMALAPRSLARWLAEQMLYPERRGRLASLVEWLRRVP